MALGHHGHASGHIFAYPCHVVLHGKVTVKCLLQGIRRIVAVTGEEAAAAIREGETLANQMAAAQELQGQDLEKEVAALKQVS